MTTASFSTALRTLYCEETQRNDYPMQDNFFRNLTTLKDKYFFFCKSF